jgi:CheY-like chemotaxis protein
MSREKTTSGTNASDATLPGDRRSAASARILVVEDQPSIREYIRTILANAGHEVAVAANGAEAVAAVRDAGFDLVLMDVHMPVMGGLMATRQIRALEGPHAAVPVIAISDNVPALGAAGMNDHIGKPFRKAQLLHKVEAWLNGSRGSMQSPPAGLPATSDRTAFQDACDLMGRPWALRGLSRLTVQIDEAFGPKPAVVHSDEQLARQAHALVSLAALLGFARLSELCSILEDACRNGQGVRLSFGHARAAASRARAAALVLIADLEVADS